MNRSENVHEDNNANINSHECIMTVYSVLIRLLFQLHSNDKCCIITRDDMTKLTVYV